MGTYLYAETSELYIAFRRTTTPFRPVVGGVLLVPRLVGEQKLAKVYHHNGSVLVLKILGDEKFGRGQIQHNVPHLDQEFVSLLS